MRSLIVIPSWPGTLSRCAGEPNTIWLVLACDTRAKPWPALRNADWSVLSEHVPSYGSPGTVQGPHPQRMTQPVRRWRVVNSSLQGEAAKPRVMEP
jgi:hypothetical protein